MRKAATILFLMTTLIWNAFAMANSGLAVDHGEGMAHAILHMEEEGHHHHDDGTLHQDRSDESMQHVSADGCANVTGAVADYFPSALPEQRGSAPCAGARLVHDSPILEGPRRPPRLTT